MKYLITGGCGFLGSNLAHHILSVAGGDLVVVDNLSRFGSEQNLKWLQDKGSFSYYNTDIRNFSELMGVVKKELPDVIFHLAGQVAMTTSLQDPLFDFSINALGTLNLLESVRKFCPRAVVIYSSTNKVYGDLEWLEYREEKSRYVCPQYPNGFPENIPVNFSSPYGCSKGSADQYVLDYHKIFGIKSVVFRHSSMFGGRQFATSDQGWVGWFCGEALKFKSDPNYDGLTISGNGKQVRDILFADDMVNLYFAAVKNIDKIAGESFNIGGGVENSLSILELFDFLENELSVKMIYRNLPVRVSDQKIFVADIGKITEAIGWAPKISKFSGIRQMLDWSEVLSK